MGSIKYPHSYESSLLRDQYSGHPLLLWSVAKDLCDAELTTTDGTVIKGAPAIAKHLINSSNPDPLSVLDVWTRNTSNPDDVIDNAEALNHHLQSRTFVGGHELSLVDIVVRANLIDAPNWPEVAAGKTTPHLLRWMAHLDSIPQLSGKRVIKEKAEKQKSRAGWDPSYDKINLQNVEMGKVVTRFPPEPSGYLHIGHVKAAMLNSHFAKKYNGKLILRFDDTNPAKEQDDYVDNIKADLQTLGIDYDQVTYTSDYFDQIEAYAIQLIKAGKAFIDDTPKEQMKKERSMYGSNGGVESRCRNQTVDENLKLFDEMRAGSPLGLKCVMRAKIDMKSKNGVMRDPTFYRCSVDHPHFKTGTKYKAYPLYDFACPIVDSIEGVTHALRSSEYHDRNVLYDWVLDALGLRKVQIEDFARLNFKYVLLSKRKLNKFVEWGLVDGWNDARFPTFQGVLRCGLTVQALREFISAMGASKSLNLMDMNKLWAMNRHIIDNIVPRYTVVDSARVPLTLTNVPAAPTVKSVPRHNKNPDLGVKDVTYQSQLFIDLDDARDIKDNEEITLLNWGNAIIKQSTRDASGKVTGLIGELHLAGNVKTTEKKVSWLADTPDLIPVVIRKLGFLITKEKLDKGDELETYINRNSLVDTKGYGSPAMKSLSKGDRIQLERKGYYIVDEPCSSDKPMVLICIPDGRASSK